MKETKGQRTRRNVIEKAAAVFNQQGYRASSFVDLVSATGLGKGGMYRHFENKESLCLEAFEEAAGRARQGRFLELAENRTPLEQLREFVLRFSQPATPLVPGGCPLMNAYLDSQREFPQLRERVRTAFGDWLQELSAIAEQAGLADPQQVASVIVSTLEGAHLLGRVQQSAQPMASAQAHLLRWLDGLAAP